jgi:hypothetical protein
MILKHSRMLRRTDGDSALTHAPSDHRVCRGQVTHHIASKEEDESWTVNKKPTHPNVKNITSCIKFLGAKRKFWPVPLVDPAGAPNGDQAGGGGGDKGAAKTPVKKDAPATKKEPSAAVKKEPSAAKKETPKKQPVKSESSAGVYSVGGDDDDDDDNKAAGTKSPTRMSSSNTKDDDDGLPMTVRPASPGADEPLVLDANGAPIVMAPLDPSQPAHGSGEDPARKFEGGEYKEVTLKRDSMAISFGFQIYEGWLGVGHGHAIVVCEVFPGSPAAEKLQRRDIIVKVNRVVVERFSLENTKEVLRELGTEANITVCVCRPPPPSTHTHPNVHTLTHARTRAHT